MKISLVTPAGKQSRAGNRTTAARWARILRDFGHQVNISMDDDGDDADMMIAIHAWRSAKSIRAFSRYRPHRPLVVLLAGTDIYKFQHSHTKVTLDAMECATKLIGLHDLVERAIPEKYHRKLTIIRQSSPLFLLRAGPPNAGLKSSLQDTYGKKKIQCAPLTRHGCYLIHPACGLFTLAGRIIEDGKKRRLPRSNLTPAIFGAEKSQTGKSENSFPAATQW